MIPCISLPTINENTKITITTTTTTTTATTTATILESVINSPERLFLFEKNSPGIS